MKPPLGQQPVGAEPRLVAGDAADQSLTAGHLGLRLRGGDGAARGDAVRGQAGFGDGLGTPTHHVLRGLAPVVDVDGAREVQGHGAAQLQDGLPDPADHSRAQQLFLRLLPVLAGDDAPPAFQRALLAAR